MEGLDQPLFLTGARDGSNRLFVVEQPGRIKVLQPGERTPTVFLDISNKVKAGGENGLLGLAFHPQYPENHRFFVCYTRALDGATVVAEYRASVTNPDLARPKERLLLEIPQPSEIHHAGMLAFGPESLLYISTGDGFWEDPENSAQNFESLRGKILRIDVDHSDGDKPYSSPSSNPFFGEIPGADEVFAMGFRNPWRFSFDRATGQLFAGDVGHEQREEIDIVISGGNYGWRAFEGTRCTNFDSTLCDSLSSIPPLIEYEHTDGRCSVIGGYVYRGAGSSLPSGSYVFGDLCTGEIMLMSEGTTQLGLDTDLNITSFGEDDSGEIYVVDLGGSVARISQAVKEPPIRIESVEIRHRSKGTPLDPITVKQNGNKYELVIRGEGFVPGAMILLGGRTLMPGTATSTEIVARLRRESLSEPGIVELSVTNPDGDRSNEFLIDVQEL
jgi:hypothetical protein